MTDREFEYGVTPFYFLRHGETNESRTGILQGQTNTELNAEGRRSVERAARGLMAIGLGSIYASPLERAWRTATIVSVLTGVPAFPLPGLMERHWGVFEGRPKGERPNVSNPETVESLTDFSSRVLQAMKSISGPSPVLVVAHSGVFRILCDYAGLRADNAVSVASGDLILLEPPHGKGEKWHITMVGGEQGFVA